MTIIVCVKSQPDLEAFITNCVKGVVNALGADVHLLVHKSVPRCELDAQVDRIRTAISREKADGTFTASSSFNLYVYEDCAEDNLRAVCQKVMRLTDKSEAS